MCVCLSVGITCVYYSFANIILIYILFLLRFSEHVDIEEAKSLFETNYSHVYYVLYDTFIQADANLRQRGKSDKRFSFFSNFQVNKHFSSSELNKV